MNRTSRFRNVALVSLLCTVTFSPSFAKIIYVDDDAPPPGDGTSWTTAYTYLQDALAEANDSTEPVEIRVAQGIYKPDRDWGTPEGTGDREAHFEMIDGMSLVGGYAGVGADDPNVRDIKAYETVLTGDLAGNDAEVTDPALLRDDPTRGENTYRVLHLVGGQVLLDGCLIKGGTAGGVTITGPAWNTVAGVTVRDCTFHGNRGNEGDAQLSAGALTSLCKDVLITRCSFICNAGDKGAVRAESGVLQDCRFERNWSWGIGRGAGWLRNCAINDCEFMENVPGALALHGDYSSVVGCVFRRNSTSTAGGAITCEGDVDIQNCLFLRNKAGTRGGGCVHLDGHARLGNCQFIANQAREDGGAWASARRSSLEMRNCTIVQNLAPQGGCLSVDTRDTEPLGAFSVRNSILSNVGAEILSKAVPVEVSYTCSDRAIDGLSEESNWLVLGPGNINLDPLLADPGNWDPNGTPDDPNDDFFVEGDYHLKSEAGRWDPNSESWVLDDVTSPCIDAGDPNSDYSAEVWPHGERINMGAYGGTPEASLSAEPTDLFLPRIACIHWYNDTLAKSVQSFLQAHACPVTLIHSEDILEHPLDNYDLIIIATDTANPAVWSDDQLVAALAATGKPILGLGDGGYRFFGELGLAIGSPNGARTTTDSIRVLDPDGPLCAGPYPVAVPDDGTLQILEEPAQNVVIYMWPARPEDVVTFGRQVDDPGYYPIAAEQGHLLWGLTASPDEMTDTGRNLFLNAVILTANAKLEPAGAPAP